VKNPHIQQDHKPGSLLSTSLHDNELVTVFIQNACLHVQKDDIMHRAKSIRSRYLHGNN